MPSKAGYDPRYHRPKRYAVCKAARCATEVDFAKLVPCADDEYAICDGNLMSFFPRQCCMGLLLRRLRSRYQVRANAWQNLCLPEEQKQVMWSTVTTHETQAGFDGFSKGKGKGAVILLHGAPGTGRHSLQVICNKAPTSDQKALWSSCGGRFIT